MDEIKLGLSGKMLKRMEYMEVEEPCESKSREQNWLAGGPEEALADSCEWLIEEEKADLQKAHNETYFTFTNELRKPMKAGAQAWICYGKRNNRYLLLNYGFCFQNNRHGSVEVHATLDLKIDSI